jgi:hypothetical protein
MPCNGRTPGERERERESSKKKHSPETMQSPLLDGKKGVGIVSVSIPSEGCSSLQKEKRKEKSH